MIGIVQILGGFSCIFFSIPASHPKIGVADLTHFGNGKHFIVNFAIIYHQQSLRIMKISLFTPPPPDFRFITDKIVIINYKIKCYKITEKTFEKGFPADYCLKTADVSWNRSVNL
jgi:hypothetical protein